MRTAPALAALTESPGSTAIILDVDGTLAPIVERPQLARVPGKTKAVLARLASSYVLVACVSGRPGGEAARLVGVDGLRYVGNHGLELHPDAGAAAATVGRFRERIGNRWDVEDKRLTLTLHYRQAPDEEAALAALSALAAEAEAAGLEARFGRKVLEIRPRLDADKGTAVSALLAESGARRGLYAGDDTTDLDAFRGLREARLEHALAVAVASPEAPEALLAAADLVVDGPGGVVTLLESL